MQRVNFHGGEVQVVHHLGGFFKIAQRLTGKSHNHVRRDGETRRLAALDRIFKFCEGMPAVDGRKGQVVCGLQADFYYDRLLAIEFCQVFYLIVFEAVRARTDGEPCNLLVLDNRVDNALQVLQRSVCIRVRLQIGQNACVRVFFA